jgi:hypothetical protein
MPNVQPVRYTTTLHMRCDEEWLARLDDLRAQDRPVLTRAEMLRHLVDEAWKAKGKSKRK